MALEDSGMGTVMPVSPMANGGFGGGYGDGSWLILFLIIAMMGFGGFGNGFGGNNEFPWLMSANTNTDNLVNAGFNQATTTSLLGDIQNSITNGFASAEVAGCNRAMDSMQTSYNNQISSLQQAFGAQTAVTGAITGLQSDLASCCCENRLASANLQNVIQTENCADRAALAESTRDIIASQTAATQRILDMMCQDKIDSKNEKIAELQAQVNMQNLAASQAAQTAQIIADNTAQTQYLVNRVAPYPIPSYPVSNPYMGNTVCNCGSY